MKKTFILATVVALSLAGMAQAYSTDIAADFSLAANPNGDWSYGWFDGGTFTLYNGVNTAGSGASTFSAHVKDGNWDNWGNIGMNLGPDPIENWGSYREVGAVLGGPSVLAHMTAARWTAPAAGAYQVAATFTGQGLGGSDYTAYVLSNGSSLLSKSVDGFIGRAVNGFADGFGPSPSQSYGDTLVLAAGDTLDFAIAPNTPAPFGLDIQVVEIPEPMTMGLLGLGGLALIRRRRA